MLSLRALTLRAVTPTVCLTAGNVVRTFISFSDAELIVYRNSGLEGPLRLSVRLLHPLVPVMTTREHGWTTDGPMKVAILGYL